MKETWCIIFLDDVYESHGKKIREHSIVKISEDCIFRTGFNNMMFHWMLEHPNRINSYQSGLYYIKLKEWEIHHDEDDIELCFDIIEIDQLYLFNSTQLIGKSRLEL